VAGDAVGSNTARTNRHAGKQIAVGIHQASGVAAKSIDVALDVTENPAAGRGCINQGHAKGAGNRTGLADVIVLETAKEECLVFSNWSSDVKTILIQLEVRPGLAGCIVEPLIGIEGRIAVEIEHISMDCVAARFGADHHVSSAVAAVF